MFNQIIKTLIKTRAHTAIKYVSPHECIRVTRRWYRKFGFSKRIELEVTVGRPNYLERKFVKLCKKEREPFPIRKIQLKFPPKKKAKKKAHKRK